MRTNVKKLGNYYEKECCKLIADYGFWVHLFAYNTAGQPCDVVALKKDVSLLIDVKHCSDTLFSFQHIRPNQMSVFTHASNKGIECGFAIYFDDIGWKYMSFSEYDCYVAMGKGSISYVYLRNFDGWLMQYGYKSSE